MANILVICGAGMTSSILVSRMRSFVAEHTDYEYKIGSCAMNQTDSAAEKADIIVIAPHLSYMQEEIRQKWPEKKVFLVSSEVYGKLDGETVIRMIAEDSKKEAGASKDKMFRFKKVMNLIGNRRIIRAISAASYSLMPVLIAGSIFILLENFPSQMYQTLISGTMLQTWLGVGVQATFGFVAVYMAFLAGYYYGKICELPSVHTGLNSMISFFLLMNVQDGMINLTYCGTSGLFCAFLTCWLSVHCFKIFFQISEQFTKGLKSVPKKIYESFFSFIPVFFCVLFFSLFTFFFSRFTVYGSFPHFVYMMLQRNIVGVMKNNILSYLFTQLTVQVLWLFGIHGGNVVGSVTKPVLMSLSMENLEAIASGCSAVNIINSQFAFSCVFGGAGSTLVLVFLMAFFSRSTHLKQLGRLSLPMGLFFINEPIIMGLPIIMNPLMALPFVFIPLGSELLTYCMMQSGLVPIAAGFEMPWNTPIIISGIIQGGWRLALWQAVIFVLQGAAWYPFFRIQDRRYLAEEDQFQKSAAERGRNEEAGYKAKL